MKHLKRVDAKIRPFLSDLDLGCSLLHLASDMARPLERENATAEPERLGDPRGAEERGRLGAGLISDGGEIEDAQLRQPIEWLIVYACLDHIPPPLPCAPLQGGQPVVGLVAERVTAQVKIGEVELGAERLFKE